MLDKASLEQFLSINGIKPTASDEEIKSVLLSARWIEDDVDTAMLVLRENKHTHEGHVDSLHKVFRSDERLTPDAVSRLLGIDMDVSGETVEQAKRNVQIRSLLTVLLICVITFGLVLSFIAGSMWMLSVGPFHQAELTL